MVGVPPAPGRCGFPGCLFPLDPDDLTHRGCDPLQHREYWGSDAPTIPCHPFQPLPVAGSGSKSSAGGTGGENNDAQPREHLGQGRDDRGKRGGPEVPGPTRLPQSELHPAGSPDDSPTGNGGLTISADRSEGPAEGKCEDINDLAAMGPLKMSSCAACRDWLGSGPKRTPFRGERELARRHHALLRRLEAERDEARRTVSEMIEEAKLYVSDLASERERSGRLERHLRWVLSTAKSEGNLHALGFPNLAHELDRAEAELKARSEAKGRGG